MSIDHTVFVGDPDLGGDWPLGQRSVAQRRVIPPWTAAAASQGLRDRRSSRTFRPLHAARAPAPGAVRSVLYGNTLQLDDLDGYAYLHDNSPIRIAAGELQDTCFEFMDLMDRGKVDVAQPDVGRVGGMTEAVCDLAADRGRLIVPHCWKTGIGIAASAHLCAATAHCPYIEFLPAPLAESPLRRELVMDELAVVDGQIPLPPKPGLGIELNPEALEKFRVGAGEPTAQSVG